MSLMGQHLISIEQLDRDKLAEIVATTRRLEPVSKRLQRCDVLKGAISANLFFEASTRTRMSFHTAFARLGGNVCDTTGFTFSSISKGESLEDTARVISGYADVIVMRHPDEGSVARFAERVNVPVINAGDGIGEHPTQALLDYYTIEKEFSRQHRNIDGMHIAMVGDLKHGRTIHSLCKLLSLFDAIHFHFIAPESLRLPRAMLDHLRAHGHHVHEYDDIAQGLPGVDIIYATRIQKERFSEEPPAGYAEQFRINRAAVARYAEDHTIILHPLPRDSRPGAFDLSTDLDEHPNLAIFRQTDNGLTVRMAIFALILGVADRLEEYFSPVQHYVPDRLSRLDPPLHIDLEKEFKS